MKDDRLSIQKPLCALQITDEISRLGRGEKSGQKKRATSSWSRSLLSSIENATLRESRDTGRQKWDMNQADATGSYENERQPPFVLGGGRDVTGAVP
jgi:hypothetical protein